MLLGASSRVCRGIGGSERGKYKGTLSPYLFISGCMQFEITSTWGG